MLAWLERRERCYGRRVASLAHNQHPMFPLRRVAQTRQNVFVVQIWEVPQHVLFRHPGCKVGENIVDRDSHAANAWLATTLSGLNVDDSFVCHAAILPEEMSNGHRNNDTPR